MSRRSSKTAHVLGLITSGQAEETTKIPASDDLEPKDPASSEGKQPEGVDESDIREDLEAPKNRTLRHTSSNPDRASGQAKAPIVEILFNDHDPLSDLIRDQLEAGEVMKEATRKENAPMSEESKKIVEDRSLESPQVVMTKDSANNKVSLRDQSTEESVELDYKLLNVSEELVRERVVEVMNSLGACTCDRCIVDTVALAVTNMPAKCIVADKDAIFPLLSYYRSKFATSVHTELMKAAMVVKDNPHH